MCIRDRKRTVPFNEQFGIKSFILFRDLRTVDLPQPEGPIREVIFPFLKLQKTFLTASKVP